MRSKLLRLPCFIALALGACASAPAESNAPETDWLAGQYFADGRPIHLPDLSAPVTVTVRVWAPGTTSAPEDKADFSGGNGIGDAPGRYYPFLRLGGDQGKYASAYPSGDVGAILDDERRQMGTILRFAKGSVNALTLNAVPRDEIERLAAAALAREWGIAFKAPRCLVLSARDGVGRYFTSVFVGGDGRLWDLNDRAIERCVLAGGLQAYGVNIRHVMPHVDSLYPHRQAPNACPLAWLRPGKVDPKSDYRDGLRCVSGARASWPFNVLRFAAASGKLKPGAIARSDFSRALTSAASALGEVQRASIIKEEEWRLKLADQPIIANPVHK